MTTPARKLRTASLITRKLGGSVRKRKKKTADEIRRTLTELIALTGGNSMLTPSTSQKKPRSCTKKSNSADSPVVYLTGSPVLRGRKRRKSGGPQEDLDDPAARKMAEDKILDAIKGVSASITAMEARMKTFSTKADLNNMVEQIKEVKERVLVNSMNIEKLFDLRKDDQENLHKHVEELIDTKLSSGGAPPDRTGSIDRLKAEQEIQYLMCRRSVRIWPVSEVNDLEMSVRAFLKRYLKLPASVADSLEVEMAKRQEQPRRSKIHKEVLVRCKTAATRDIVQSYAANLAEAGGSAGLRLEVPDFLRGLFRKFESHGAALREAYGTVKRAIRFNNEHMSLSMDVKLESTQWHNITALDMEAIGQKTNRGQGALSVWS